ncbi:hypothetical protein M406DRAFT_258283 [Cryphonectria parasitica EP155]|uniref:RING-type domain-containing protein n=1 Tax=Cryphonectria parasitica (strain ATCC 38755 / EP155) TaxID=660469 RepID=A0A9P4Y1B2_CRYP1|nr:uncharacterized protein M406DRAFT_258283 [Cryphonectria parasitica EP155]KAF3764562.1 hypothetical protein M406DRAFT_258283 [Cryphonectria parasitica EP155]
MRNNRIIVGVKYCFRYNARNRNMRMTGEDGEPINLENMPQHPRRRRREKKLMTIDEVNEKFPMMKYKSWVASRAQEGLPTQGGISHPPSRAASLADADGIIPVTKERESTEDRPATSGASITTSPTREEPTPEHAEKPATAANGDGERQSADAAAAATAGTSLARTDTPGTDDEHEEDDDQIHDALPPEALESSGDTCAICIDTLEDDDDVRGLTCGHAFHAGCLDPWLISRRACCPLCKADYYTPKPRPAPAEGGPHPEMGPTVSINQDPRTNRMNMPSRPGVAWALPGRRGRVGFPSWNRRRDAPPTQSPTEPRTSNSRRPQQSGFMSRAVTGARGQSRSSGQNASETTENQSGGFMSNIRMPRFNLPGRSTQSNPSNTAAEVTPSDLEAGTRTDAAR